MVLRTYLACFLLIAAGSAGVTSIQPAITLNGDDIQRGALDAQSTTGFGPSPALQVESARVDLRLPSGTPYPAHVTTVFDPQTERYWWTFQGAGPYDPVDRIQDIDARFAFYSSGQEIVGAQLATPPPSIWISRSTAQAASIEKARSAAIDSLRRMLDQIEDGTARFQRQVNLWDALPADFLNRDGASPAIDLTIESIVGQRQGWRIELADAQGRRGEVHVDELFGLLRASILAE